MTHGFDENRTCACKVVLLAGPHKAASTTLQTIALQYSNMNNVQWFWLGKDTKEFASFVFSFMGINDDFVRSKVGTTNFDVIRQSAKNQLELKYNQGYNILLGSEEIDNVNNQDPALNTTIIDSIINILPEKVIKYRNHLSSLVVYRAPRHKHLKSVWGELQYQYSKNDPQTFKEFICGDGNHNTIFETFHMWDSLSLARKLLEKDIGKVHLFDMSTLNEENAFFSMLGCHVMGLDCAYDEEKNQTIPVAIDKHRSKTEILHEMTELTNSGAKFEGYDTLFDASIEQTAKIEDAVNRYDCAQYKEMMNYNSNHGGKLNFLSKSSF